jgi:hypothetical protein
MCSHLARSYRFDLIFSTHDAELAHLSEKSKIKSNRNNLASECGNHCRKSGKIRVTIFVPNFVPKFQKSAQRQEKFWVNLLSPGVSERISNPESMLTNLLCAFETDPARTV